MAIKSVNALTPVGLSESLTQNNASARADIPRHLSGNVAWIAGHTKGGDTLDSDTPNLSPRSPMTGQRGHTHSGGIDGKGLFRTVASLTFETYDVRSSNLSAQNENARCRLIPREEGTALPYYTGDPGDTYAINVLPSLPIFVPGCDPRLGVYRELAVRICYDVATATNVAAGDVLSLILKNVTTGIELILTDTALATGVAYVATSAADEVLQVVPGSWNELILIASLAADATAGVRTFDMQILELELGVYAV